MTIKKGRQRDRFTMAVSAQHGCAVKTADAIRRLVLFDYGDQKATELADIVKGAKGKIDPLLQLVLLARNDYRDAEDGQVRLGFFKAMKDLLVTADDKTMRILDMIMKERHHMQKLAVLDRKVNGDDEPEDAELEKIGGEKTTEAETEQ